MERPHHVSRLLSSQFETDGPLGQKNMFISRRADTSDSVRSILRATRVLKAGMVIFIASDVRWSGPNAVSARFLGSEFEFSTTWVMLAALSGAPVVPVYCTMSANAAHSLEFLPRSWVPSSTAHPGEIASWVQRSLDETEKRVREHPSNSNEYFFWSEPSEQAHERAKRRVGRDAARGAREPRQ
jgi:lauroyl/myristoyl acyltransferase